MHAITTKHFMRKACKTTPCRIGVKTRLKQVQHFFNTSVGPKYFLIHYIRKLKDIKRLNAHLFRLSQDMF